MTKACRTPPHTPTHTHNLTHTESDSNWANSCNGNNACFYNVFLSRRMTAAGSCQPNSTINTTEPARELTNTYTLRPLSSCGRIMQHKPHVRRPNCGLRGLRFAVQQYEVGWWEWWSGEPTGRHLNIVFGYNSKHKWLVSLTLFNCRLVPWAYILQLLFNAVLSYINSIWGEQYIYIYVAV